MIKKLISALLNNDTVYDFKLSIRDTILRIMGLNTETLDEKKIIRNIDLDIQKKSLLLSHDKFDNIKGLFGKSILKPNILPRNLGLVKRNVSTIDKVA